MVEYVAKEPPDFCTQRDGTNIIVYDNEDA
jgi:hypothetical protein